MTTKNYDAIHNIIEDVSKLFTLLITMHVLEVFSSDCSTFFNDNFVKTLLFLLIGIIIYHFVIKRIHINLNFSK